jgi:putative heme-binding domain-containing protein
VKNGIAGTEMPGFQWSLTDTMTWRTAAYVRSLGRRPAEPVRGDPTRGAATYEAKGCQTCHVIAGRGTALGPELTAIGALRGPAHLRESIVKPEAAHQPGYLVVRAMSRGGGEVRGIRVDEDVFWIHVRDATGTLHVLEKKQLQRLDRELTGTLMPSYEAVLSAAAGVRDEARPSRVERSERDRRRPGAARRRCRSCSRERRVADLLGDV